MVPGNSDPGARMVAAMDVDRDRPRPVRGKLRMWRAAAAGGCLCMSGTTTSYAVDPLGEYVFGVVVGGADAGTPRP